MIACRLTPEAGFYREPADMFMNAEYKIALLERESMATSNLLG
jgi:hypothetical protein